MCIKYLVPRHSHQTKDKTELTTFCELCKETMRLRLDCAYLLVENGYIVEWHSIKVDGHTSLHVFDCDARKNQLVI